jgi:hypothetical protein
MLMEFHGAVGVLTNLLEEGTTEWKNGLTVKPHTIPSLYR